MRVISLKLLRVFWEKHQDAATPLRKWYRSALHAHWRNIADVRHTFPHADAVNNDRGEALTVFNIGGNKYRLITRIRYDFQLINIRQVLTHAQYDKGNWKR